MAGAGARSLLRSSSSLLRAAAPARSSSSLGAGASRPSIRRALGAPPRPLLRSPVEASFCLESLLPLHSATAAARLKSMLAVPGQPVAGWLTQGQDETGC
ncbi:protein NUCLEAR FUSION DEFECTIVE 6, mitochondrial-like [Lolium perenne]|uniref:protein NUCLEAR FUSION DEFECTIVE 6, mitochondrial-like n=1 Tax=Lolium perenne TaxID=4522 RepID=UPI0021F64B8B|nr:protein NUCLEAR FUSION DEFECTIVE 6, mitochondrial-like [Lolium perenne]